MLKKRSIMKQRLRLIIKQIRPTIVILITLYSVRELHCHVNNINMAVIKMIKNKSLF